MTHSRNNQFTREIIVLAIMVLIFLFWIIPITALASLLSYEEIKRTMPWLGRLIDSNEQIRALAQNVLPSVAMISLNALLPFLFESQLSHVLVMLCLAHPLFSPHVCARLSSAQLGRVLPASEILLVFTRQRRIYFPSRQYILATHP